MSAKCGRSCGACRSSTVRMLLSDIQANPAGEIPVEVRPMISEKFRLDRELHEWAARFRGQLRDIGSAFLREREAFDRMNVRKTWWTRDVAMAE
jgi:hypothetical protein